MNEEGLTATHLIVNPVDFKNKVYPKLKDLKVVSADEVKKGMAYIIDSNNFKIDYSKREEKKSIWIRIKNRIRHIWYAIRYGID